MTKIGDQIGPEFWDRLELKLKMGIEGTMLNFKGWQAALMRELVVHGAAMTGGGAHSFVCVDGVFMIDPVFVLDFILEMHEDGWIKSHKEQSMKDKRRKRLVFSSAFQVGQFVYEVIVHEEEEE